jgi:hypothetical protein
MRWSCPRCHHPPPRAALLDLCIRTPNSTRSETMRWRVAWRCKDSALPLAPTLTLSDARAKTKV